MSRQVDQYADNPSAIDFEEFLEYIVAYRQPYACLKFRFGISDRQLYCVYLRQKFRCGGCHEPLTPFDKTDVDHCDGVVDETTGKPKIRGIACRGCNRVRFPVWDRGSEFLIRAIRLTEFYLHVKDDGMHCVVSEINI